MGHGLSKWSHSTCSQNIRYQPADLHALIEVRSDALPHRFEELCQMLAVWEIRPVVDKIFDFEDASAAFAYLKKQIHVGKVVVRVT